MPKFAQVFWNYFAEEPANFPRRKKQFQKIGKKDEWRECEQKEDVNLPKKGDTQGKSYKIWFQPIFFAEMWYFCVLAWTYLWRQLPLGQKHQSEFWERIVMLYRNLRFLRKLCLQYWKVSEPKLLYVLYCIASAASDVSQVQLAPHWLLTLSLARATRNQKYQ